MTNCHDGDGAVNHHALRTKIIDNCIISSAINESDEVEHGFENPTHTYD